jgi:phosphatidylglycerophosphatase A
LTDQPAHKKNIVLSELSLHDKIIYWLGVGFGSGLSPKAPGTVASFAILVLIPLWLYIGFWPSVIAVVLMSLVGIPICDRTANIMQVHDDSRIVWDEFAGQSIALLPLLYVGLVNPVSVLLAFALFRLFDIWKPWPIRHADQQVHGGFGIMLDDILAGIIAAIIICAGLFLIAL